MLREYFLESFFLSSEVKECELMTREAKDRKNQKKMKFVMLCNEEYPSIVNCTGGFNFRIAYYCESAYV